MKEAQLAPNKLHYSAIDGLRALAAVGILLMHVRANGNYGLSGFVFEKLIPSFTNLTFLFMIVSSFSMCCGYYEKILTNSITVTEFYGRRFAKIWPFFAFWSLVELFLSPSENALYEVFANLTLCFGLLPDAQISVIGVGWFIGLVFVFYLLFPFVCYLLSDKRKAWMAFVAALVFNYLCTVRFEATRTNIIYSAVFFLAGGMIFLYKEQLGRFVHKFRWLVLLGIAVMGVLYFWLGGAVPVMLALCSLMLIYTMDRQGKYRILSNRVMKFLSGISMEIYLCHMVTFRMIEKLGLAHLTSSNVWSFVITAAGTICGTIILAIIVKKFLQFVPRFLKCAYNKLRRA